MVTDFDDEYEVQRFTREQAVQNARAEAKRDLTEGEAAISYVAYVSEVHAFCLCEFVLDAGSWFKTSRLLMPTECQPDEEIHDETILELARSGNMVSAVRLYRAKHGVGLKEALVAVQQSL